MNYLTTEDGKPINSTNPLDVKAAATTDGTYIGDIKFGEALPAGTALIGKVGIDQTTPGTTNKVVAKISQTEGENLVQLSGSNVTSGTGNLSATFAEDPNGDGCLRMVDAAPFIVEISKYTTATHTEATVGVATTAVLAANINRKYALFINDSDATIYLKIGANAALNEGIRLNANGGSYEMSAMQGNLTFGAINGISASASKKILVTEGV